MSNSELDTSTITKTEIAIGVIFLLVMAVITFGGLAMMITGYVPEFLQPEETTVEEQVLLPAPQPTEAAVEDPYPPLSLLPEVAFPPDNPYSEAKVELGKNLYFDTRFSGDGSLSCNSCHPSSDGSWAVSSPISFGYPGSTHWRNASTIVNTAFYSKLNWDGSKTSIEVQNKGAWGGAVAGNVDSAMAEERLAQIPEYVRMFNEVFGTDYPLYEDALKAVATFERTIVSQNVPFDAFLEGSEDAISEEAIQGYELFTGKAGCIACHNGPLISDDSFHNTGVPQAPEFENNPLNQITFRYEHWAKGVTEEVYNTSTSDLGLYYVTKLDEDKGKFRTPGLRDVCYSAPYMHNGTIATLDEVVAFYNAGGGEDNNKDDLLQPLNLTEGEQMALVSFLESLCGDLIIHEAPELPPYEPWVFGGN
jgi:cytochrome c peroxidase